MRTLGGFPEWKPSSHSPLSSRSPQSTPPLLSGFPSTNRTLDWLPSYPIMPSIVRSMRKVRNQFANTEASFLLGCSCEGVPCSKARRVSYAACRVIGNRSLVADPPSPPSPLGNLPSHPPVRSFIVSHNGSSSRHVILRDLRVPHI